MDNLPKPHRRIFELADELEKAGEDAADIVDALLVIGINAGVGLTSREQMAAFLETTAMRIRAGGSVETRH
jgi:fructoselysine-6-P-deglycase FrlB-like protein